ncbi:hypothetical protein ES703_53506 [subsurface metagenome]
MFDTEEYNRWMNEANNTFKSAIVDKDNGFYNWCCFKCHQAAEFAIKALLYGLGSTPFGHSLTKMVSDLKNQKLNVSHISTSCKKLDLHYIPSRYPNAHPTGSPFEYHDENIAEDALENATKILDFVKENKK